jgi:hypothetical protein
MASPALCVIIRGTARLDGERSLGSGDVRWIDAHTNRGVTNTTKEDLEILMVGIS